ncbi:EAL domain-containing protein [Accumulibacter sp.]|uniref:Diguanylate cyclase/phosphodiesterase with PAS/PAC sensor(S) n=1 Tax=Accumulibacter regalis TaxID=522306 RepID=C7RMB6_ACCRE|nr:EAL domain-containing protein [Accumulibacter sp.]
MSIRARLLLLILFATLIPALVAGIQFIERRDTEISGASEDLAASVQEIALDLKDIVRATAQLHYGLARAPELDTRDQAACSAFLADVLNEYPQYTGILTIKPSGDLFCDSLRSGRTMNLADRRYFQNALNPGNPLAVEAAFGRLTGTAVLQIAYAARNKMGELKFILLASLDLDKTMQSRSRTLPRRNAVIALVDNKGTVFTWHPDTEKLRGRSIADSPLFRFAREQTAGAVREDLEFGGVSRIWAVSTLPEFPEVGLHVVVGVSKQDLLAAANRNLVQALAILLAVWLLVFGGAWVLARGVMDRGLAEEMRIRELNEQLEQRVLERTARLESANQELNREIAERSRAEAELRIAAIAFDSQEGMMVTDAHGVILRVNRAFVEETGYSAEDVVGRKRTMLTSGREDAALDDAMWETVQRCGAWQGEVWDRRKNGEVYPVWLTISAVKGQGGLVTHYVATHIDITQRKAVEDQLHKLAFYDPLTQLPNRRLLLDRLGHVLAGSTRSRNQGAIMFIDLDNFKALNDTQGHDVGDRLLAEVAQRLKSSVRQCDTVARLGGDEFVVMVQDLAADSMVVAQVEAVAGKILAALDCPYRLVFDAELGRRNALNYHCTASIGITLFGAHSTNVDELLKQADLAMYQAKDSGRNAIRFFDPEMQAAITSRVALEADLREAVEAGQFQLYYQPQVVGESHRLTGAEALLRWHHSRRGMVPPSEFIPLAEETGLILPLGQWVLETACAQLATWASQPEMAQLTVAVNVSAHQIRQTDFVDQVLAVLADAGANPQRLKLELTESLLVSNVEDIIAKMTLLKSRGVGFSLDDFGTGYSSLSYLKRLPLDQLKIDQSFVNEVLTDANDAAIAKMIVALAESLGLAVIAEGVETEEQRNFLAESGCHAYQGYLFSKPLPLAGFEQWIGKPTAPASV